MRRAHHEDPEAPIPPQPSAEDRPGRARALSTDVFAPPKAKAPRKPPTTDRRRRQQYAEEAEDIRGRRAWAEMRPGHFVALYVACHERVYGAAPTELDVGRTHALAVLAASRLLKQEFHEDPARMFDFLRWAWDREEAREKWRRDNRREGGRIGWRLQFGAALVTDYRVEASRRKHG
jgi:hypothetical protein